MNPKTHETIRDSNIANPTENLGKAGQIRVLIKKLRQKLLEYGIIRKIERVRQRIFTDPDTIKADNTEVKWFACFDKPVFSEDISKCMLFMDSDSDTVFDDDRISISDQLHLNIPAILRVIKENEDLFEGCDLEERMSEYYENGKIAHLQIRALLGYPHAEYNEARMQIQVGVLLGYPRTECEKWSKYNEDRMEIAENIIRFSAENPSYIEGLIEEFTEDNLIFSKRSLRKKFKIFLRALQGLAPSKIAGYARKHIPQFMIPKKWKYDEAIYDEIAPFIEFLLDNSPIDLSNFDRESINYFFDRRVNGFMCHTNTPEYHAWQADLDAKIDSLEEK